MTTNNGAGGLDSLEKIVAEMREHVSVEGCACCRTKEWADRIAALQAPGEAVAGLRVVLAGDAHEAMVAIADGESSFAKAWNELDGKAFRYTAPPSDVLRRVVEALELAREFGSGLPHSLGYEFTHLPKIDAAIAAARQQSRVVDEDAQDAIDSILKQLEDWSRAYPTDIFHEPTQEERDWLHATKPGLMDCIAASMGRHMAGCIAADLAALRAALEGARDGR